MTDITLEIARLRLASQQITRSTCKAPHELVRWFGAMQAQDYAAAKWAVASRLKGYTDGAIEQAIDDKQLVRTWPMRGTIHFVPPEDAHWMLELMAGRVTRRFKSMYSKIGLEEIHFQRATEVIAKRMQGAGRLTRKQLMEALEQVGIDVSEQRGYHVLVYMAHHGHLAITSLEGKQPTFVWFDDWLPKAQRNTLGHEEALAEMARRYIRSHGPVTVRDFAWWTGLGLKDARDAFASIACSIRQLSGDESYWLMNDMDLGQSTEDTIFLAAPFDETIVALKDRRAVISSEAMQQVTPYTNGVFSPVVLLNGQFAGLWRRTVKKNGIEMAFSLNTSLSKQNTERLRHEAERYAAFHEMPLLSFDADRL